MIPLIKLKKDVDFNKELTYIMNALKGVALSRYHRLKRELSYFEKFTQAAQEFVELVDTGDGAHPFVKSPSKKTSVVMVTSDAGFLGGLNSQVVTSGLAEAAADGGEFTVIGERGANYMRDSRKPFKLFPGIQEKKYHELAATISDHVLKEILSGKTGKLVIVYPKLVTLALQKITVEVFLPCTAWIPKDKPLSRGADYIWESRPVDVLSYIVTQWISYRLTEIFAMSRLAEMAARVMHLEGSYQELIRRGKQLRLQFFRARHEIIDRSMREVFAGQIMLRRQGERDSEQAENLLQLSGEDDAL